MNEGGAREPERQVLSPEQILKTWTFYSAEKTELKEVCKVVRSAGEENSVLVCLGQPYGYLRSPEEYETFEFGLEWRYPSDPNGNSGVLVFTRGEDKIWPDSVQVQLHHPTSGSIFPSGSARTDNTVTANGQTLKEILRPADQWNTLAISSREGRLAASINGRKVGEVTGCMPIRGLLSLQSEGSEVHFRNIWVKRVE